MVGAVNYRKIFKTGLLVVEAEDWDEAIEIEVGFVALTR